MKFLLAVTLLVSSLALSSVAFGFSEFTVATAEWSQASYSSNSGTKATVMVTDPDMNKHPNTTDYIWVTINSDSDPDLAGTRMVLFETGFDTGVFEREIVFSDSPPSGKGFLHVQSGDTIHVKYIDATVPDNYTLDDDSRYKTTENGVEVHAYAVTGIWGPPMIRIPVSDLRLMDISKESTLDAVSVPTDQHVMFVSDLESQTDETQRFVYLVQITDDQDRVESLSWITGNLTAFQKLTLGVTWIPFSEGTYTATAFVWEAINNPTAHSPPMTLEFVVQ